MYNHLNKILSDILEIIEYRNNRQEFIQTFLQQCRQITTLRLVQNLPKEKQEEVRNRLSTVTSGEAGKQIIMSYLDQKIYENELDKTSQLYFQDYIKELLLTSSSTTKAKLQAYMQHLVLS